MTDNEVFTSPKRDIFGLPPEIAGLKAVDQQEQLSEDAWELAKQLLHSGSCVLKDGKTNYTLGGKDLLKHVQWLAALKSKKPRGLPAPKDVHLKKTSQMSDDDD